jgi:hypothetical protein
MMGQTRFLFAEAAGAVRHIEEKGAAGESDTEAISAALADDDAAKALAVALAHVVAHEPALVAAERRRPSGCAPRLIAELVASLVRTRWALTGWGDRRCAVWVTNQPGVNFTSQPLEGQFSASVDSH